MTSTKSTMFGVSACMLLAVAIVLARPQDHELSGIQGIPVEGHDSSYPVPDGGNSANGSGQMARSFTVQFTIVEGKRSRPAAPVLSPAERCMRQR